MPDAEGHKWFAVVWDRMVKAENSAIRQLRDDTVKGLQGRALEIGCGNGANFARYPDSVTELQATDPDPYMLKRARARAHNLGRKIEVRKAPAEQLPYEDASFDAVVATLVLCTVADQARALLEIRRVLKPGRDLRFFEHVRYEGRLAALMQDLITPVWRWCGAGCHPNRNTAQAIEDAGFRITALRRVTPEPPIPPMWFSRPCIQGRAAAP